MKFIFPQNYHFKNKLLGIIDYSTLLFNIIWDLFVFSFINLFFQNTTIKIFIFIIFCFPLLLFSIVGFNHENIFYIIIYLIKYIQNPKLYFYNKKQSLFVSFPSYSFRLACIPYFSIFICSVFLLLLKDISCYLQQVYLCLFVYHDIILTYFTCKSIFVV